MDYKGYCFWASDIPDPEAPHYIVITSSANPESYVLVVVISSIKYKDEEGTVPKYYDKACELNVGDIVDDKGRSLIIKPSFVRYEWSQEIKEETLMLKQFQSAYKYKCKISDELLKRIQEGAKKSEELEERFKKYFPYF